MTKILSFIDTNDTVHDFYCFGNSLTTCVFDFALFVGSYVVPENLNLNNLNCNKN